VLAGAAVGAAAGLAIPLGLHFTGPPDDRGAVRVLPVALPGMVGFQALGTW
jgi:hypothetical protein